VGLADRSRWRFVITDMSGNTPAGTGMIINAGQKTFSYQKNAGKTATVVMNIDHPIASYMLNNDALMKVYRQTKVSGAWQRMMVGEVIQAEEAGQGDTAQVIAVAADPWWRIQRRVIGMGIDSAGRGTGYTDGTALSLVDNSILVRNILNSINGVFNTGVQLGSVTNCGTTGYLGPLYAQNVGTIWQQLCNTLGGPDFEIVPIEPTGGAMPATIIGTMNIVGAGIGQVRSNTAFEYGCGRDNMSQYSRVVTKDGLCDQAFSPPQGFPTVTSAGDTMIIGQDTTAQNARGLFQDIVQGDLTSRVLRTVLANEYVTVRKQARQQITMTPTVDNPMDYNVDYQVGDIVTARAMVKNVYRFNGTVRIYGVTIALDENDAEAVTLNLVPQ
jgi:hypothetical protein